MLLSTGITIIYCFQTSVKYLVQLFESERQEGRALERGNGG